MLKKKILFLTPWYPNRYDPMPGLFVKRHAEILADLFSIAVLHVLAVDRIEKRYETTFSIENEIRTVRVYYKKNRITIPLITDFLKIWRLYKAHQIGFKEIKKHMGLPDLAHVNVLTRVGVFALYLKIRFEIPYVITEHWSRYLPERNGYKGYFRKILTKWIVRKSAAISTVSQRLKEAMTDCGLNHPHFYLVNNVVDFEFFKPICSIINNPLKVFSNITCFDNEAKNVNGIIQSVYRLTKLRTDFLCLMVGDGADRLQAEILAEQLGIKNTFVKFTGMLEGDALVEIYNQSLFTVLFSNYENMPVVLPESFACGKPVIATRVGGIPEFVNETNGALLAPGDESDLVDKLNFMLSHYGDYDAACIRNSAYGKFSTEAVRKQLMQLYKIVI